MDTGSVLLLLVVGSVCGKATDDRKLEYVTVVSIIKMIITPRTLPAASLRGLTSRHSRFRRRMRFGGAPVENCCIMNLEQEESMIMQC